MKIRHRFGFVFLAVLLFTGCGKGSSETQNSSQISIIGSSSVEPLISSLADQYYLDHPDIDFFIQAPGSSTGIRSAIDGTTDIGMSSRELTQEESESDLYVVPLARDGIAMIVNNDNPIDQVTMEELYKIFHGDITNWQELGGFDRPILLVSRESGSGTRDAFDSIIGLMDGKKSTLAMDQAIFCDSTNSISQNVADKGNAIGYVSLGSLQPDVKLIMVDGVACSEQTILSNEYPISRPFDLLINQERWTAEPNGTYIREFLEYVGSDVGQSYISQKGFIPVEINVDAIGS